MTLTISKRTEELLQTALANRPGQDPAFILEIALSAFVAAEPPKRKMTPAEAVADLREMRKGLSLGGLKIKDLVNEGRKY